MDEYLLETWQELAWNGIRFMAPDHWQVGSIGIRYLMLEDEDGPTIEAKWGRVKGSFSHRAFLRRLGAQNRKKYGKGLKDWTPPPEWTAPLDDYKIQGFRWRADGVVGRGILLYCPECRTASLMQFLHRGSNTDNETPPVVLSTFKDHGQDDRTLWSIFDIRAVVPSELQLWRHSFEAGRYELTFSTKGCKLSLYRWGPASVILTGRSLGEFAALAFNAPEGRVVTKDDGPTTVEWRLPPSQTPLSALWNRLKPNPGCRWFRMWHLEPNNKILGVKIDGWKLPVGRVLDQICDGYGSF